jgi:endonuclease YncB( thermonuclease family)
MRALLVLVALTLPAGEAFAQAKCRAIDGDTIRCGKERVRLQGVYAPERGEPGAAEARARLQQRLNSGEVRIERRARDRYGRTVGDVYVGGSRITQHDVGRRGGRGARR